MTVSFGTDGIRGVANLELTPEMVLAVGRAVSRVIPSERFAAGRDSRRSSAMLQAAVASGLASEGADVHDLGVLTTPGVAWYCETEGIPGIVVSASHNPFRDNGIKVFATGGVKLDRNTETAIENEIHGQLAGTKRTPLPSSGHSVGRIFLGTSVEEAYLDHLLACIEGRSLAGLAVVVDGANGAAWKALPEAFRRAGADVVAIGCDPDGVNINDGCGSTHPEMLAEEVVAMGAHLGIAVDGDGDRLVAVTSTGRVLDGDELIALFALDMQERGRLAGKTVAVTVMSNLGLTRVLRSRGIEVRETPVGDRHILEEMEMYGLSLGGEQSGHIVFRSLATTGDGILTGLLLADLVVRKARSLDDLTEGLVQRVPQVLMNVAATDPGLVVSSASAMDALRAAEELLVGTGRVLLRASGTEALVRVMVECENEELAGKVARDLVDELVGAASRI
ncbi:MAG: phosphoglucosamine mutase [Actinobacteria bacterium]|nr:phosphoglucosamine mutase [Actinomycetota bacterium]MCL5446572.1 phosphoglucosamine mutase [Actinomycetota bacterium]